MSYKISTEIQSESLFSLNLLHDPQIHFNLVATFPKTFQFIDIMAMT